MKVDVSKIAGYADMSAEEKLKALEEYDDGVDMEAERSKSKMLVEKANAEAAKYKRGASDKDTEIAQLREDVDKLKEERETLRREKTKSDMKAQLIALGYGEALADSTAQAQMDGDMATFFENQKRFLEERDAKTKAELLKGTPKPAGIASGQKEITKEEFARMGYTARMNLLDTNPELYKSLNEK